MTYQDQIKSPKWQKKRLEVLEQNKFSCEDCGDTEQQLHVHHSYYKKGKKIWEYKTEDLVCLCETCHKLTHDLEDKIRKELADMERLCGIQAKAQVLGYIKGMIGIPVGTLGSTEESNGYMDAYGINGRVKASFSGYLMEACHGSIGMATESIPMYFDDIGEACCNNNKTEEDAYNIIALAKQIADKRMGGK